MTTGSRSVTAPSPGSRSGPAPATETRPRWDRTDSYVSPDSPYLYYVKWDVLSALEDRRLIDGLRFLPFIGQRVHCNLAAPVFAHDEHAIWNLDVPASNPQVLQSW